MTREIAISILTMLICQDTRVEADDYEQALEMAIQALSQEPCTVSVSRILKRMWNCRGKHTTSIDKVAMEQIIRDELTSVIQIPTVDVLDKIRAEIEEQMKTGESYWQDNQIYKRCLWIIEKHIKEKNKNEF